jgi:glycosyltransferase involved in cell wall biosynthesis
MEKQSFELVSAIQILRESHIIAWRRSQAFLPWFLLSSFVKACWILLTKNIDLIHLGDALLSPTGYLLRRTFRVPVVATVHGRDVVFSFKPYQIVVSWSLKRLDRIICVSKSTQERVLERGIPHWKTAVIPNGITIKNHQTKGRTDSPEPAKRFVEKAIAQPIDGKTILLTVGRLVARKGVNYFIREVLPGIVRSEKEAVYFVVGEGPHQSAIEQSIGELGLDSHVVLFGRVDKDLLSALYRIADIFVMPNIPVEGDMEGFGIVTLEACLECLPVVASDLEGIKDAITHGENGCLVDVRNTEKFISTIVGLIQDRSHRKELGTKAREFVISHFSWHDIGERYLGEFERVIKARY